MMLTQRELVVLIPVLTSYDFSNVTCIARATRVVKCMHPGPLSEYTTSVFLLVDRSFFVS